jgi:hypothetical protein
MMTWEQFLDELELRIARSRSVTEASLDAWLDSTTRPDRNADLLPVGHFEPPRDLGPIPAELTDRARALVEQARAAEAALSEKASDVWEELRATPARRPDPYETHAPVFLDQRA